MANALQWLAGGLCGATLCSAAGRPYLPAAGPTVLRVQAAPAALRPAIWPVLRLTTPPPVDPTATNQPAASAPELPAAEPGPTPTPEPPPVDSSAAASTVTPVVLPETDVFRPHLWLRYFVTGQTNQGAQPVLVAPVDFTPPPAPATPSSRATYSTTP